MMNSVETRVKLIFPDAHEEEIKQVSTLKDFEDIIDSWERKYDYKIMGFLREGEKYLHLKKHQHKVRAFFPDPKSSRFLQGGTIREEIKPTSSGIRSRRQSEYKMLEFTVEFKYKPQFEIEERLRKIRFRVQQTEEELQSKIKKAEETRSYYTKVRIEKRLTNIHMRKLKIWILISEPLVKITEFEATEKLVPVLREQVKVHEDIELLKNLHSTKNKSINLEIQAIYISMQKVYDLVSFLSSKAKANKSKGENSQDADCFHLVHLYVEVVEKDKEFYVQLEDDHCIGKANRNCTISNFMEKIHQIPNLLAVVLMGPKAQLLPKRSKDKEPQQSLLQMPCLELKRQNTSNVYRLGLREHKDWLKVLKVPTVVVGLIDCQKDLGKKIFMKHFYSHLFERRTIREAFKLTHDHLKNVKQMSLTANCCCVHWFKNNYAQWGEMEEKIGAVTLHKIFDHKCITASMNMSINLKKQLFSFILNTSVDNLNLSQINCTTEKHMDRRWKNDMFMVEKEASSLILNPENIIQWEAGEYINSKPPPKVYPHFRPRVLYDILQLMNKSNQFSVLTVTGSSKSGKSLFIELAKNYLANRSDRFQFENFYEWLKCFRSGKAVDTISLMLKKVDSKHDSRMERGFEYHFGMGEISTKLVINVGKINYDVKPEYESFLQMISDSEEIRSKNLLIMSALGETQGIVDKNMKGLINFYTIPQISEQEIRYFVLKDESIQLWKEEHVTILRVVIESLKSVDDQNVCTERDFKQFCKHIMDIIKMVNHQGLKEEEMKNVIGKEIWKYNSKTKLILTQLKETDPLLWETIGFFCSFKEGFFICDFSERIVLNSRDILEEVLKKQSQTGCLFRKYEHLKLYNKEVKNFTIQADKKCYKYFDEHQQYFFKKKLLYFFNLYYHVYLLMVSNPRDVFCLKHWRCINGLGIFMYSFAESVSQILTLPESKQMMQIIQSKPISEEDRAFIFETVLQKNLFLLIEHLRAANARPSYDILQHELLLCTMLFASIAYREMKGILEEKRVDFKKEISQYVKSHPQLGLEPKFIVILAQINVALGLHGDDSLLVHLTNDCINDSLLRVLARLQAQQNIITNIRNNQKLFGFTEIKREEVLQETKHSLEILNQNMAGLLENIGNEQLEHNHRQKHYEAIVNLLLMKAVLKFKFFNEDNHPDLDPRHLEQQLSSYEPACFKCTDICQRIKIVQVYLRLKISIQSCHNLDLPDIEISHLPLEFQEMYQHIRQKLNPKLLFKSENIMLFMKSSCLRLQKGDYSFVRMSNIISSFLSKQLNSRKINVLFLNLSHKNFEMVSSEKPLITYLVLSVDSVKDQNGNLHIYFEDSLNISGKNIEYIQFKEWVKTIKIQVLIIFGSKSHELGQKIFPELDKTNICLICLTMDKPDPGFNLCNYPDLDDKKEFLAAPDIVSGFLKMENSQRIMQLTLCGLVSLLVSEKEKKQISKQGIEEMVNLAKNLSLETIRKWYQGEGSCDDKMEQVEYYPIKHAIYLKEQKELPIIEFGQLHNLTSQIIATPNNLNNDSYYENVGRTADLEKIMRKLCMQKSAVIEVQGGKSSGKTQFLKEIGWFCQTRKVFPYGVYLYDVQQLARKAKMESIMEHINKHYTGKQFLLILLDNLEECYVTDYQNIFNDFFFELETKRISLVYTIKMEPKRKTLSKADDFQNLEVDRRVKRRKNMEHLKIDLNAISDVDKICIALTKLRHRGNGLYRDDIEKVFPGISRRNFQLKNKLYQTIKQIGQSSSKRETKNNKKVGGLTKTYSKEEEYRIPFELKKTFTFKETNLEEEERNPTLRMLDFTEAESKYIYGEMPDIYEEEESELGIEEVPSGLFRGRTSTSSTYSRPLLADLMEIIEACRTVKQEKGSGDKKIDYIESYLKFDSEIMRGLLEKQNRAKVIIFNNHYFGGWSGSTQHY